MLDSMIDTRGVPDETLIPDVCRYVVGLTHSEKMVKSVSYWQTASYLEIVEAASTESGYNWIWDEWKKYAA